MDILTSLVNSRPFVGYTIALIGASICVFRPPRSKKAQRGLILLSAVGLIIAGVPIIK